MQSNNNWRKAEDERGFPYYFDDITKVRQWDHPKFIEIKQRIDDCNYVKYSRYRVACKFRTLQQLLYVEEVPLNTIVGVFERHKLGMNESSLCLDGYDLEAVLHDIYFATNKQKHMNIDVGFATEMMQNLIYNVYDRERRGATQVSSIKLVLAILSDCDINQLYTFLFKLCSDHNNCVTRLRLQSLLLKLVDISNFMHEDASFGQHLINTTIENCFINSPGLVGISESNFLTWLKDPPQLLSWIRILFRIRTAEPVVHYATCSSCKISPLMGLRYRCMKCSKFIQCQRCFFTGQLGHSHKLSHSMKEYCTEAGSGFSFTFIKTLCGLLPCSTGFVETSSIIETKSLGTDKDLLLKPTISESRAELNIEPLSSPHVQLQSVIKELELQNRELHRVILLGTHNDREIRNYLVKHKDDVAMQIRKLKVLKDYLNEDVPSPPKTFPQSTPMGGAAKRKTEMDILSPITQVSECCASAEAEDVMVLPKVNVTQESSAYTMNDISTWFRDKTDPVHHAQEDILDNKRHSPATKFYSGLDEALAKLQQILANNFSLEESLGNLDNNHLKYAVSEVEGMLTSFIDTVESSRASSVQRLK